MTLSPEQEDLVSAARDARSRAYAPYSDFTVGAALDVGDGHVYCGSNVENASYGLTICAERAALVSAIAGGYREFETIAIAGPDDAITSPCGACRQVLAEFNPQMTVIFTTPDGPIVKSLAELLPYSFGAIV